jgi:SPP1 family predicted phage head-tail adaptor
MGLNAGRLKDRITIRRQVDVADGKGGYVRDWTTVAEKIAAEVVSQGGRESLVASALQGISSYRITIRLRADVRPSDQILYRPYKAVADLELNIRSAAPDPFAPREAVVIFADTEAPQGA